MKKYLEFLNESIENEIIENEIVDFLIKKRNLDKKEYKGDIKTKYNPGSPWNDESWMVDEIIAFLKKDYLVSYILMEFGDHNYLEIEQILSTNFKKEYDKAKQIIDRFI
jgi:hypothetical protein